MKAERYLVAIPAYNEAASIAAVIDEVQLAVPGTDVVVIDDGSTDETAFVCRQRGVRVLSHYCNLGYGYATQTAILFASRNGYDALLTLDADGQHDPGQLPALVEAFQTQDADYLIGSRHLTKPRYAQTSFGRKMGMIVFSVLTRLLTGERIYDTTSGLRLIDRPAYASLLAWGFVDFH